MERVIISLTGTLVLATTLLSTAPSVLSEQHWEDLQGGPSLDLVSADNLIPTGDDDAPLAQSRYADLTRRDARLLIDIESRVRSAYVTQSGALHFTETTDCNRLKPVCVGRMGIADKHQFAYSAGTRSGSDLDR